VALHRGIDLATLSGGGTANRNVDALYPYLIRDFNSLIRDTAVARLKQIGIDVDVNGVIESHRRAFSETDNDILRRILLPTSGQKKLTAPAPARIQRDVDSSPSRARGLWAVEFLGERKAAANLKDAYRTFLLHLNGRCPDFLEKFSRESARSRRFVARNPADLYFRSPHLAAAHARKLFDGWYYDTNLSTEQVGSRIRIAARLCNLHYGSDVRILDNLKEI
jgi:hypothetical protein